MAGIECSKCCSSIRYHGEPNGIQFVVFTDKMWNTVITSTYDKNNEKIHNEWSSPEPYLYRADTIWWDFPKMFQYAWVCPKCGTIILFKNDGIFIESTYAPIENTLDESPNGSSFIVISDYIWDEITDLSIPTKDIPTRFAPTYSVVANDKYLWVFESASQDNLLKIYERMNE